MSLISYHLLKDFANLEVDDETDLIVAGDGVYSCVRCFGMHIPFPLVLCEIRGLLPLSSLFALGSAKTAPLLPFGPSYHILTKASLPALDVTRIYQYVVAGNGVFLLAGCPGLEVLMPVSVECQLPGLVPIASRITWKLPFVGEEVVQELFDRARAAKGVERLFYLACEEGLWRIHEPEQVTSATAVRVVSSSEADEASLIEGHSHHEMAAYFSSTDNVDELVNGGFKVYFVLGRVSSPRPQIRVRVCVHGYSWEVPASLFFALPAGTVDCGAKEERTR